MKNNRRRKVCGICGGEVEVLPKSHFEMPVCDRCLDGDIDEELLEELLERED